MGVKKENIIYILEGADGSGKSTLAGQIAKHLDGNVLHQTFKKEWDMEEYAQDVITAAWLLSDYQAVILNRWVPSEYIYSKVFRSGEPYDTKELIDYWDDTLNIVWIYCKTDKAIENHARKDQEGLEMFHDNVKVIEEYDKYIKNSKLPWITYDYEKQDIKEFLREIT